MWKKWETVTESERDKIAEIADKYEVPIRDVASMFQSGLSFDEINKIVREVPGIKRLTPLVICDDDVDVISITTRSKKIEGDSWVIGIFDVADNTEVCIPNIEPNNKLN